ncbi:RICIN domain-containing protein [Dulcicalothrix desertica]|uniref:RICIN domain-containing protein n=1 Tax=Dulcicalothrix desertica TaxID=32056 RepID=UPI000F8D6A7E|nr:RICIN domain-containing protein [Dulcicalothrix desertica]
MSNKHHMWAGQPFTTWSEYSGKCMDVANASVSDYTSVGQYTCHGGPNQKFRVQYVPGT